MSQLDEDALDESARALFLSTLPDMYDSVDRQLDRILRALPEDADLIVLSPVGMGTNNTRADFLGRMLTAVLEGAVPAQRAATVPLWRLRAAVPTPARGVITRALGPTLAREVMARSSVAGVDWSQDQGVRRAERPPRTDQAQPPRPRARRESSTPRKPTSSVNGSPRVCSASATRTARRACPPSIARRASSARTRLRCECSPTSSSAGARRRPRGFKAVESPAFGRIERTGSGSGRSGGHTDDAFALLVPGRSRLAKRKGDESVVDLAATACALLGADMSGLAGTPLFEPA